MSYNENEARHSVPQVKMTKHFIGVSDSDGDSYGTEAHNPGTYTVQFLNPNLTNVSSPNDATKTVLHPISMSVDVLYDNISVNFRNNRFRVRSTTGNLLQQNGTRENGTNPTNPATFDPTTFPVVTIPSGVYRTGAELGAAVLAALNAAAISWFGGNQIAWTGTTFDANSGKLLFKYATAAPAGTPQLWIESLYLDPVTQLLYESSRILGITGAVAGPTGFTSYTDGALLLPYAATQGAGAGTLGQSIVDLQTIDVIQLRCPEVAKRYFRKQGTNPVPGRNPLSFVPILFELPLDTTVGSTFYWMPQDDRYSQEISSDFSTMTFSLTDKQGKIIPFNNNAEMNFQFYIEREVHITSNAERIKAMSEYNRFKSF